MDVLKPALINVGGRCYRVNPVQRPDGWDEPEDDDDYNGNWICILVTG